MSHNNPNLLVISGGPGSGKTTVVCELARLGFQHVPEVARRIIQEQVRTGGTALPWPDREMFARLMLQRSVTAYLEHTPALSPVFYDRGIPDRLCYARLIGIHDRGLISDIQDACRRYRYAPLVFLAPPWKQIYATDTERRPDFDEAERTFEQMAEVYQECGYQLSELPKLTPVARVQFILEQLQFDNRQEVERC